MVDVVCKCLQVLGQNVTGFRKNHERLWLQSDLENVRVEDRSFDFVKTKEMFELYPDWDKLVHRARIHCVKCGDVVGFKYFDYFDCSDESFEQDLRLHIRLNPEVTTQPLVPDQTPIENRQFKRTLEQLINSIQECLPENYNLLHFGDYWTGETFEVLRFNAWVDQAGGLERALLITTLRLTLELLYGQIRRDLVALAQVLGKRDPIPEPALELVFANGLSFDQGGLAYLKMYAKKQRPGAWKKKLSEAKKLAPKRPQNERTWIAAVRSTRNLFSHDARIERHILRSFIRYTASGNLLKTRDVLFVARTNFASNEI